MLFQLLISCDNSRHPSANKYERNVKTQIYIYYLFLHYTKGGCKTRAHKDEAWNPKRATLLSIPSTSITNQDQGAKPIQSTHAIAAQLPAPADELETKVWCFHIAHSIVEIGKSYLHYVYLWPSNLGDDSQSTLPSFFPFFERISSDHNSWSLNLSIAAVGPPTS